METVAVTRKRTYQPPHLKRGGYEWKWTYYLPQRESVMPDGRIAITQPGGFTTKSEIVDLARRLYEVRPLCLEFPDGSIKEIKR